MRTTPLGTALSTVAIVTGTLWSAACSDDEEGTSGTDASVSTTGTSAGGGSATGGATSAGGNDVGGSGAGAAGGSGSGGSSGNGGGISGLRCGNPMLPMTLPAFAPSIELQSNGGTGGTASGDLDGDGRDEFVAQIRFRIYDFDGTTWQSYPIVPNLNGRRNRFAGDIELADMNGDGRLDIIVPDSDNSGTMGSISWFENPGQLAGTWTEHQVTVFNGNGAANSVTHLSELEVADIDNNGGADIIVRDVSHGVWVLLQQGNNDGDDWAPRRFIPTLPREGLRLWDPNGDGRLDLLLNGVWLETPPNPVTDDFVLHPIKGMEAWYAPDGSTSSIRDYASKVEVADFNGDGRIDMAITNSEELAANSPNKPHGITIYLQPTDPVGDTWTEVIVSPDHFSWHTLMLADFDFDGSVDLLTAISRVGQDSAGNQITMWLNNGSGTSFVASSVSNAVSVYQGMIGDADGDGDCDFVAPDHFNNGPVRYFENTTAP